jgi:peptidoglycan/LPS O-acetylase OafA/YrhL
VAERVHRLVRYLVAVVVAAAVTGGVGFVTSPPDRSVILLVGVAQVYLVGTAVALRYPDALRRTDGPNWASGAFAGVLTFGCVSLLNGAPGGPNAAVVALAWGLGAFGLVVGVAIERERGR